MTASFSLVLDTAAPASPVLSINDGASVTGEQVVWARITTADYDGGADDVSQMKIWGDVDPSADPSITLSEAASAWITYEPLVPVVLSAGDGHKSLYARLRDDVGNMSLAVTDTIDLDTSVPVVTVTTPISRGRISKVTPHHTATFTWKANVDVAAYEVRVVPGAGSPHQSGVLLGTAHGGSNTSGGPLAADTPVTTLITGADLEAASPGNTAKVIKVFVRTAAGQWSA